MAVKVVTYASQAVAAAGTAEALVASETLVNSVILNADSGNTGEIAIGDDNVVAAVATRRGQPLAPGESVTISGEFFGGSATDLINLADIYVDAINNDDKVNITATVRE